MKGRRIATDDRHYVALRYIPVENSRANWTQVCIYFIQSLLTIQLLLSQLLQSLESEHI